MRCKRFSRELNADITTNVNNSTYESEGYSTKNGTDIPTPVQCFWRNAVLIRATFSFEKALRSWQTLSICFTVVKRLARFLDCILNMLMHARINVA